MATSFRVGLLAAGAILLGCADVTDERNEHVLAELRARERIWNTANIKNYSMIMVRRCAGCAVQVPGPVRVEVVDGIIVRQYLTASGAALSEAAKPLVPGVDGLFAELKRTLSQNWRAMEAAYDPELGFPTHIRIDFDRTNTSDDLTISVSDFTRD